MLELGFIIVFALASDRIIDMIHVFLDNQLGYFLHRCDSVAGRVAKVSGYDKQVAEAIIFSLIYPSPQGISEEPSELGQGSY